MKRRGVKPETVRLELSDGVWVDIKRVLTVGAESDNAFKAMKTIRTADSAAEIDGALMRFLMAATYVQGWSLLDYDGQPIKWPVSKPAIPFLIHGSQLYPNARKIYTTSDDVVVFFEIYNPVTELHSAEMTIQIHDENTVLFSQAETVGTEKCFLRRYPLHDFHPGRLSTCRDHDRNGRTGGCGGEGGLQGQFSGGVATAPELQQDLPAGESPLLFGDPGLPIPGTEEVRSRHPGDREVLR